ncbi:MAG: pantetheine-phosphate adenylyltransferase [Vicinamibacterales bacterium]
MSPSDTMTASDRLAICPGSFDPMTNGHLDIIGRAARLFSRVVVTILGNASKQPLFTVEERVALATELCRPFGNVSVDTFDGLLVEHARRHAATVIVRGVRSVTDFDYEWQMAMMNRGLGPEVDTVLLLPGAEVSFVSSRLVKEIYGAGGDVGAFVPPLVLERLRTRSPRR